MKIQDILKIIRFFTVYFDKEKMAKVVTLKARAAFVEQKLKVLGLKNRKVCSLLKKLLCAYDFQNNSRGLEALQKKCE